MWRWIAIAGVAYAAGRASGLDAATCPDGAAPRRASDYVDDAERFCTRTLPVVRQAVDHAERFGMIGHSRAPRGIIVRPRRRRR